MNNLGPSSKDPTDQRPHQKGKAKGKKNGQDVEAEKEWMFDTGATVSAITKNNADKFDLTPVGATASGTTGGGGIIMKRGLTMVFSIIGRDGNPKEVRCSLNVGVKPNNSGSEIIGMDQIATVNAVILWNPKTQTGRIYET